ncbi:MAG TPA: 30S ribosomal protein S9 [Pirellulaceae bacterium]|nr:30S ribosomal protein S9 [Pirellulaceae bacterium]
MVPNKKDAKTGEALGTGRRKTSVARVRIKAGSGKIIVNGRAFEEYFPIDQEQQQVLQVIDSVNLRDKIDVTITASGGGRHGQSGAARMGIARALVVYGEENFPAMRDNAFLTRDSRMKERKKYGLRGARRGVQFSKR